MAMKIKHNGSWITIPTSEGIIKIKYADLKTLAEAGELKAGCNYLITDFITTVIDAADSRFASLAKPFNVLVYAQTAKKLGMYAKAVAASEDTTYYFKDSKLDQWLLKYDMGGNYNWVSADGGTTLPTGFTGTIYYMEDEFGNVAPYDFKNVTFKYTMNAMNGATLGLLTKNPSKNITYTDSTTSTVVTIEALKAVNVDYDVFLYDDGTAANMKAQNISNLTFATTGIEITNFQEPTGALPYITVNSKKYEYYVGKNIVVSDTVTWYAWINDEGEYIYTDKNTGITPASDTANSGINLIALTDVESIAPTATSTNCFPTIGTNDGTTVTDSTLAGTSANNIIKSASKSVFPFIYLGEKANNVKSLGTSNNISVISKDSSKVTFKGNEYLVIVAKGQDTAAGDVVENYTFIANYGGDSDLAESFAAEYSLAVETLVGQDNSGYVVAKNVLSATRNFYQRNEPLEANEGDLWFTIED